MKQDVSHCSGQATLWHAVRNKIGKPEFLFADVQHLFADVETMCKVYLLAWKSYLPSCNVYLPR